MSFSLSSFIPAPSFIQVIEKVIEPLNFPECPGVYVMVNTEERIIYTGKAKNLRDRIKDHSIKSHNPKVDSDIKEGNVKEIKVFCCQTELDAIILERYFIQSGLYRGIHNIQYTKKDETGEIKEISYGEEEKISKRKRGDSKEFIVSEELNRIINHMRQDFNNQKDSNKAVLNQLNENKEEIEDLKEYVEVLAESLISIKKQKKKKKNFFTLFFNRTQENY